ncbi:MAG: lipid II flippase MurJ, partial [Candidatus Nanopelagicales bacterium]
AGAVVPLLAGAAARADHEAVSGTVRALTGWVLVLLVPAAILCAVFARPIVTLVLGGGSGCDAAQLHDVASSMLRVFAVQIPIYGLTVIAQGALNAHHRFFIPALAPLMSSLVVIASYLAYGHEAGTDQGSISNLSSAGLALLAWGSTAGVLVLLLTQVPSMARLHLVGQAPSLRFPAGVGERARKLAAAGFATVSAQWIAFVVLLRLANQHSEAGASLIVTLLWTVFLLPWAVLSYPIVGSTFPRLSALFDAGKTSAFNLTCARTLRAVVVAGSLGAAGVAATADPVADLMLSGAPGSDATSVLSSALRVIAPAVLGYAVLNQSARVFFARHLGRDASVLVAGGWTIAVVLALIGMTNSPQDETITRLAGAVSIGLCLAAVAAVIQTRRVVGAPAVQGIARSVLSSLVAGGLAATAGVLVTKGLTSRWGEFAESWQLHVLNATITSAVVIGVFAAAMMTLDGGDLRGLVARLRRRDGIY